MVSNVISKNLPDLHTDLMCSNLLIYFISAHCAGLRKPLQNTHSLCYTATQGYFLYMCTNPLPTFRHFLHLLQCTTEQECVKPDVCTQRCADAATVARSLCTHMHMLWLSSKSASYFIITATRERSKVFRSLPTLHS